MQAAVRLIDTMDLAETSRAAMDTMVDVLLEGMDARFEHEHGETFPKELSSEVRTIVSGYLNRELSEQLPLIKQRTAAIYARHFSISELDRLTFLMSDPAMRKLTRLMPVIMPELAQTSTFTPEMGQELEALVREAVMNWASKQPRPAAES